MTKKIKQQSIERYCGLWNQLQVSKFPLNELETISQPEFESRTGIKGQGQFNLSKSLARNTERQKQINTYLQQKKIPSIIIPKIPEKQYISKYTKPYKPKLKKLKFSKSKFQGYNRFQTSFLSRAHSKKDIKNHLNLVSKTILGSKDKTLDKGIGYGIKTKIHLTIINPKDKTESEMYFYANGKVCNKLKAGLSESDRFPKALDDFCIRLGQSELQYRINSIETNVRVIK